MSCLPASPCIVVYLTSSSAHEAPKQRSIYWKPMGDRTKWWIKATRVFQLCLRVLEGLAGAGLLVMFILFKGTGDSVAWVMRITVSPACVSRIRTRLTLFRAALSCWPASTPSTTSQEEQMLALQVPQQATTPSQLPLTWLSSRFTPTATWQCATTAAPGPP